MLVITNVCLSKMLTLSQYIQYTDECSLLKTFIYPAIAGHITHIHLMALQVMFSRGNVNERRRMGNVQVGCASKFPVYCRGAALCAGTSPAAFETTNKHTVV